MPSSGRPATARPAPAPPTPVLLDARRSVTVTREEHHQDVLARYAPAPGGTRRLVADLAFCRIGAGKYRGGRGIEVRLGGHRVGELTHRMSERYAGTVEAVQAGGRRADCEATISHGDRGFQVEVWLPDAAADPQPGAPRDLGTERPTERFPQVPGPRNGPSATAVFPGEAAPPVPTPRARPEPASALARPERHTSAAPGIVLEPRRRRIRGPHWVAAGVVGVALLAIGIGAGNSGEEPADVVAATVTTLPERTPVVAAPTTTPRAAATAAAGSAETT
ncbi:MAG: hypothetical protein OJJ54_03040, partial [Pseudonocardia sp.]|nr:hypothetical protein [Pseudonocardia sp.]